MIRRSSLIALEIVLGLVAAVLIGLGLAWWRLSQGPVELNFIRQHVQAELSDARSGRPVGIERVELAWSQDGGALELRAVGVTVQDGAGKVLSRSDEARIELSALPLLIGRVSVERATFSGGELSLTRRIDGAVYLAFGPPGSPPDIIVPPPPPNESLEARVNRVLDGMQAAFEPVGPGGRLREVGAQGVRLAIIDESTGGRWTAESASFNLAREQKVLNLVAEARLEGNEGPAPATLRIVTDTAFQTAIVEFGATEVRPRALLSPAALGPFAGLDAPMTAVIAIGLDRKAGVTRLEGDVTLGQGVADMGGEQFRLDGGAVRGRYDIATDELIIDQLRLAGAETSVTGEVRIKDASAIMRANSDQPAALNIALPNLRIELPGVFATPVDITNAEAVGVIVGSERSIRFSRIHAQVDEAVLEATGRLYWGPVGTGDARRLYTGVELDGAVAGALDPRAVVALWPIGLGEGARDYLSKAVLGGRVTGGVVHLDVHPSDVAAGQWRNEAADIRFNFTDAQFRFIETMSPITNGRGSAIVRGNRFELDMPEGRLNNLTVTNARVEIPHLKPRGGPTIITGRVEGDARNIVEVLLQQPLALGDRLPVDPASVTGRGAVNLRFTRPNMEDVPFEQLRFNIDGRIDNFAANMSTRRMTLSQGRLDVRGDQRAITISGPIRAGQSNVNVQWTELINQAPTVASSQYQISGDFDADDLERLGYPVAQYAQGRIGVVVSGDGRGFDVDEANIQLDLRNAVVDSPFHFWTKRAGQTASASFDISRAPDGAMLFSNINARGAGLIAQGSMVVGRDEQIRSVDLSRLAIEGRSDARLVATRADDGALNVQVTGALFDAGPFMDNSDEPAAANAAARPVSPPVHAQVEVERLKMRGGATLANASVELLVQRDALARLVATGQAPGGRSFNLGLGVRPGFPDGRIVFDSQDAGFAVRALTGTDNVVGGTVTAEGTWRWGPPSTANFTVHMRDFQVVRMPAMALLLSSAGSLTGLAEALNGDGIGFDDLDAPLVFANDRIRISDARAAGPALGLTASGRYDMDANNLDIDGVVAPSYGLNSMLGNVPVVGDLFVSRQGEGVFGMTYSINGPVAEPRVGVNPLSALTPGIFRRIFEPTQRREPEAETRPRRTGEVDAPLSEAEPERTGEAEQIPVEQTTASLPAREMAAPAP